MATTDDRQLDPSVVEKFHFTREAIEGPVYRKYEKAIRKFWRVEDLDFTQDAQDWERIDEEQRRGLLGVTVRFLAGEQNVTNELVPMLAAAQALGRFDWTTYLSTFLMEEAKHAEFFMRWHDRVVGVLEPEEVAQHFLVRGNTIDPSGRFEVRDVLHEALPYYGRRLLESTLGGEEAARWGSLPTRPSSSRSSTRRSTSSSGWKPGRRMKRWTCVEAGCSYELTAEDVPSAVEGAQRHIAEEHGSFELSKR